MGARTLVPDRDHVVYFYDRDEDAVEMVASYLATALLDGKVAFAVATPEHRAAFVEAIATAGVDVGAARADGRLLLHDAATTLERFLVNGAVDEAAFEATVAADVRAAVAPGREVRAYGEMVALLWASGRVDATLALEKLWDDLARTTPLSVFCGYPRALLGDDSDPAFSHVCQMHSRVVDAPPLPEQAEVSRHFARTTRGPGLARRFVAETLAHWGLTELADAVTLVVGELATNAVVHGDSAFTVAVSRAGDGVRVEVGDCSPAQPRRRPLLADRAEGGRGLLLVDAVADRWGHEKVGTGKLVWAVVGRVPDTLDVHHGSLAAGATRA